MIDNLKSQIEEFCRFCNPPEKDRILYETSNFYVMLSLGPIVEGYLLIISKKHIECCGAIDMTLGKEFDDLAMYVKGVLQTEYGGCLFYEHGQAGSCLDPMGSDRSHCFHAHLHCIPSNIKLNLTLEAEFSPINIDTFSDFRFNYQIYPTPYFFVDDGRKNMYHINKEVRSQYLRFHLAKELGEEKLWNWVEYQGWERIKSARERLKKYFSI